MDSQEAGFGGRLALGHHCMVTVIVEWRGQARAGEKEDNWGHDIPEKGWPRT